MNTNVLGQWMSPLCSVLFVLLVACGPDERAPETAVLQMDTPVPILPQVVHRDSVRFDPDGFYIPRTPPVLGDYRIVRFRFDLIDRYGEGLLHEDSVIRLPPRALVVVEHVSTGDVAAHTCRVGSISPDTVRVACEHPAVGEVRLEGRFLVKTGRFSDVLLYEEEPTEVLRGVLSVRRNGDTIYEELQGFTYWAGD